MNNHEKHETLHENLDPITGEPGAHPIGTSVGAASGAVAGMAAGAIAGPVGVAVGGIVGAFVGGLVGRGAGEEWNPTAEELYWGHAHSDAPYLNEDFTYDDYAPAYRAGYQHRLDRPGNTWDQAESELYLDWDRMKGSSRLPWEEAKHAALAAWTGVANAQENSRRFRPEVE